MKKRFRIKVYDLIRFICIIGIIACLVYCFYNRYRISEEETLINSIQLVMQEASDTQDEEDSDTEKQQQETQKHFTQDTQMIPELKELYAQNEDLYGWIKIEGTNINYPVMFTPEDPNFYIDKNWEKQLSYKGVGTVIWIDGRTTKESENVIIYGHNSKSYTTFRSLTEYRDSKQYYEEHKYIEFYTLYEKQTYEIISVSKAAAYNDEIPEGEYSFYDHIELDSKEEFDTYLQNLEQNAYYQIETTAEYGDKLITLSTCDYWAKDIARLIIVAKKI